MACAGDIRAKSANLILFIASSTYERKDSNYCSNERTNEQYLMHIYKQQHKPQLWTKHSFSFPTENNYFLYLLGHFFSVLLPAPLLISFVPLFCICNINRIMLCFSITQPFLLFQLDARHSHERQCTMYTFICTSQHSGCKDERVILLEKRLLIEYFRVDKMSFLQNIQMERVPDNVSTERADVCIFQLIRFRMKEIDAVNPKLGCCLPSTLCAVQGIQMKRKEFALMFICLVKLCI